LTDFPAFSRRCGAGPRQLTISPNPLQWNILSFPFFFSFIPASSSIPSCLFPSFNPTILSVGSFSLESCLGIREFIFMPSMVMKF
jgi:hypothetical protein